MAGMHFSVHYQIEGSEHGGCIAFTVRGESLAEAKAWGEQKAWEYIHEARPNSYALESRQSGPVKEELLGVGGFRPLDWDAVRTLGAKRRGRDFKGFGQGSSLHFRSRPHEGGRNQESEFIQADTLQELRKIIMKQFPPERMSHLVDDTNWDADETALYVLTVGGEYKGDWDEVVLCEASNIYQAGQLWLRHSGGWGKSSRSAGVMLASGLCAVGEPLFRR